MKKALITGITGQDGSYLAEFLLEKGYDVHGIIRRSSVDYRERIAHLEGHKNFHLHYGDLGDTLSIIQVMRNVMPDEVYNLAAQSHVQVSFDAPEYTANVDATGVLRILEAVRQCGLADHCRIYQASTSELYGRVEQVPQVFIPYKEVLEIMESGLRVPDDVTLMWCDDNYGYMTRLSDAGQQQRQGGGGVYYHLSYWGRPHDYLWLTTTQPGLIYNEMKAAYDHNCRRLWIANVHDPKVAAYDLEFFLDMAWDINGVSPSTLEQHLEHWLCTQFGVEAGRRLSPIMHEFYRLNAIRKPEFMGWTQVELDKRRVPGGKSRVADIGMTRREAAERTEAFNRLEATIDNCRQLIRPELADAFEAHIVYPVYAAAAMTRKIAGDSVSSFHAYEDIQQLTNRYNTLHHGKWNGLMDAAPRQLPVFDSVCGNLADDEPFEGIACNACDYDAASMGCQTIQMLGHSMNAVTIPKGGDLVFHFRTPLRPEGQEEGVLYTAMIPTQPNGKGDLRYQVFLDDEMPVTISLKEPFRSEQWKQNVLRGQALKQIPVKLTKEEHILRIKALDDHIIIDQWMLDFKPNRKFYVIPVKKP